MEKFIQMLREDTKLAEDFRVYLSGANDKVKQGTEQIGKELDKLVMETILGFAKEKGIQIQDSENVKKQLSALSKQVSLQMNEMIIKQFKAQDALSAGLATK